MPLSRRLDASRTDLPDALLHASPQLVHTNQMGFSVFWFDASNAFHTSDKSYLVQHLLICENEVSECSRCTFVGNKFYYIIFNLQQDRPPPVQLTPATYAGPSPSISESLFSVVGLRMKQNSSQENVSSMNSSEIRFKVSFSRTIVSRCHSA